MEEERPTSVSAWLYPCEKCKARPKTVRYVCKHKEYCESCYSRERPKKCGVCEGHVDVFSVKIIPSIGHQKFINVGMNVIKSMGALKELYDAPSILFQGNETSSMDGKEDKAESYDLSPRYDSASDMEIEDVMMVLLAEEPEPTAAP